MKMETKTIKKSLTEGILEMKDSGIQTGATEENSMNRIHELLEIILGTEDRRCDRRKRYIGQKKNVKT